MPKKSRPLGITLLALIVGIIGVLQIIGAVLLLIAGGFIAIFIGGIFGLITGVLAIVALIIGFVGFRVAQGLWGLKPWAWNWSVVWTIIVLVLNIFSGSIWYSLVGLLMLIYLYTVRDHF
ncbi:MAG: hypothetical protein ACW976_03525 [Candidatus Ranarchaeia archaeon]|jgi:hypothetical protein